ncbi:MAG: DUF4783 domain-containing protein [Bacteroidales bacterium]|nr:DUF4783 domain-containing protein [Bacteroidales bacterium]
MNNKKTIFYCMIIVFMAFINTRIDAQSQPRTETITIDTISTHWSHKLPKKLFEAVERGDVVEIVSQCSNQVEMSLPSGSGIYSKKQAEVILSEFFASTGTFACSITNEKTIGAATRTIATLKSKTNQYRLYILRQSHGATAFIQQFRIEEQND